MPKPLNTLEKKLKFHCSVCQATWQLLIIRTDNHADAKTKCLNNCPKKWEKLLIAYCQERQIIYFATQEKEKDEKKDRELSELLRKLKKENGRK
ncbi:protein of unknown function [endosymbiont DhMRE of Dentiscutata heterogama]|uniref:hypothetical protein n=1 Tax=endosymbiont DhMRE of Dentiscutata heterogama TaxID=1609546 RepID=UPI000629DA42|nr:hypothetical protein [endosymbiont DhMRE of Dentiscutata heterogama]CFW93081.1 protein of unknown function [endosymbiont DhMRE of Dentiscutata heterogama]